MGKYIKSVFAAVTILVIILPLPSLINNGCDFDNGFLIQNEFELDENFLHFADRMRINSLERGVAAQLSSDGIANAQVNISGVVVNQSIQVERVEINLTNAVIRENLAHINKYEHTQELVARHLNIALWRVTAYSEE